MHIGGNWLNYSFFIFIDFLNPFTGVYKNLVCLHKKGHRRDFDFSNTLENLRAQLNARVFIDLYFLINYDIKSLKLSITFKDPALLENINYYINRVMGIDVIRPYVRNTVNNKINNELTFKSDQCVICLTNPSNVLFCNCGHLCICVECDRVKSLNTCPVCKTQLKELYNIKIFSSLPGENILLYPIMPQC